MVLLQATRILYWYPLLCLVLATSQSKSDNIVLVKEAQHEPLTQRHKLETFQPLACSRVPITLFSCGRVYNDHLVPDIDIKCNIFLRNVSFVRNRRIECIRLR